MSLAKPPVIGRRYSGLWVHGPALAADKAKTLLTIGRDLHLVAEAHVVLHVLAGHADVIGDLVGLVA